MGRKLYMRIYGFSIWKTLPIAKLGVTNLVLIIHEIRVEFEESRN